MGWFTPYRAPDFPSWRDIAVFSGNSVAVITPGLALIGHPAFYIEAVKDLYVFEMRLSHIAYYQTGNIYEPNCAFANFLLWPNLNYPGLTPVAGSSPDTTRMRCKSGHIETFPVMRTVSAGQQVRIISGISRVDHVVTVPEGNLQIAMGFDLYYMLTN